MPISFREAVAEVELGLLSGEHLPDIATAGLLEGYRSPALEALAGLIAEPYDPVRVETLWNDALGELELPALGTLSAARLLVRAYARLVVQAELLPQIGASRIAGVQRIVVSGWTDGIPPADPLGVEPVIRAFRRHDDFGYASVDDVAVDDAIVEACRQLVAAAV